MLAAIMLWVVYLVFITLIVIAQAYKNHDVVVAGQESVKLGVDVGKEAAAEPVPSIGRGVQGELLESMS